MWKKIRNWWVLQKWLYWKKRQRLLAWQKVRRQMESGSVRMPDNSELLRELSKIDKGLE